MFPKNKYFNIIPIAFYGFLAFILEIPQKKRYSTRFHAFRGQRHARP